jgi:hypothetical protein
MVSFFKNIKKLIVEYKNIIDLNFIGFPNDYLLKIEK